jgi:hypothetical protein
MWFFKKKVSELNIEINDIKINKDICKLLAKLKKNLADFMNLLEGKYLGDKDEKLEEILMIFSRLNEDVRILTLDVENIQNIELQRKDYIRMNDTKFISDKLLQLNRITEILTKLIDILEQRPRDQEFKEDLLRIMINDINELIEAVNRMLSDDTVLQATYKSLENSK